MPKKILRLILVDDNVIMLTALRLFLGTIDGVEIVGEARNGDQAVALAELHAPDIILMDLNMPGGGGLGTTRVVKTLPRAPRVVVLSLHAGDDFRRAALEAGADFFVAKERLHEELPQALARIAQLLAW